MATTAQRLAEYENLFKQSQAYDPNKFQGEFEKAYGEATNYNKDLIEQQSQALGEVQAVAPTLRERYMNTLISDPTKQMALIAQARQAPITQYGTAANLLTARGNRYQDILGKALGGYQTSADQANTAAENAWRLYQDAVSQEQARRAAAASRGGGLDINSLLDAIYGGQDTATTGGEGEIDITIPDKKNGFVDYLTGSDLSKGVNTKNALSALSNPIWSTVKTGAGLLGNFIGNTMVPKRKDQSFIDKLFNR